MALTVRTPTFSGLGTTSRHETPTRWAVCWHIINRGKSHNGEPWLWHRDQNQRQRRYSETIESLLLAGF